MQFSSQVKRFLTLGKRKRHVYVRRRRFRCWSAMYMRRRIAGPNARTACEDQHGRSATANSTESRVLLPVGRTPAGGAGIGPQGHGPIRALRTTTRELLVL